MCGFSEKSCKFAVDNDEDAIVKMKQMDDTGILQHLMVFTDSLEEAADERYLNHCLHLFCTAGGAQFSVGDTQYNIVGGDAIIKATAIPIHGVTCSADFRMFGVLIQMDYLEANSPQSQYSVTGTLSMIDNPVLPMSPADMHRCHRDVEALHARYLDTAHTFYMETLRLDVQRLVFDLYDIHARHSRQTAQHTSQPQAIMNRFVTLLGTGIYRRERRPADYARRLCISAKYLSEACVKVSGHNASYWIDWYTRNDLSHQLRDTAKPLARISEDFSFSSLAHFSNYVKKNLGQSPSEYRKNESG
jgi:AraC-like DNA-binding protein